MRQHRINFLPRGKLRRKCVLGPDEDCLVVFRSSRGAAWPRRLPSGSRTNDRNGRREKLFHSPIITSFNGFDEYFAGHDVDEISRWRLPRNAENQFG